MLCVVHSLGQGGHSFRLSTLKTKMNILANLKQFLPSYGSNFNGTYLFVIILLRSFSNGKKYTSVIMRFASKKTSGSTRNSSPKVRPKHRGWKKQEGHEVHAGTILATQRTLRFHPGLNV